MATFDAVATIDGKPVPVRVGIGRRSEDDRSVTLDEDWLKTTRFTPDQLEQLDRWVAALGTADPLPEEGRFAADPALLQRFLTAQGYREVLTLDDGTLIVHRPDEPNPAREYLAFQARGGLDVVSKEVPAVRVYDELLERGSSLGDFDAIGIRKDQPAPIQSLRDFLTGEGLQGQGPEQELSAWVRAASSSASQPPLRGIRERLAGDGLSSPIKELDLAGHFLERLRAQGYEQAGHTQDADPLPIHRRIRGTEQDSVVWRTGPDGRPRYRKDARLVGTDGISPRPPAFRGREGDFAAFLREEGRSLGELPAGYGLPLALPLEEPDLGRDRRRATGQDLIGADGPAGAAVAPPLVDARRAAEFPLEAFLTAQGYQPHAADFKFVDGTQIYTGRDSLRTLVFYRGPGGEVLFKDLDPIPDVLLHGPDGPNVSLEFTTVPGPAQPLAQLLATDHPDLSRAQIEKEVEVWSAWSGADEMLPPLRGVGDRQLVGAATTAADELAAARAFAQALVDAGFQSEGTRDGLVLAARRGDDGRLQERIVWRVAEDGQPRWKALASYLDLDVWDDYQALPGQEQGLGGFHHRHEPHTLADDAVPARHSTRTEEWDVLVDGQALEAVVDVTDDGPEGRPRVALNEAFAATLEEEPRQSLERYLHEVNVSEFEARFLTDLHSTDRSIEPTTVRSGQEAPEQLEMVPPGFPLPAFLRAQGYWLMSSLRDGTPIFARNDDPNSDENPGEIVDLIAVRTEDGHPTEIKYVRDEQLDQVLLHPATFSFDTIAAEARPGDDLFERAGPGGALVSGAKELALWKAWSHAPGIPPLRGMPEHLADRTGSWGLSGAAELAYAKAFAHLLRERGFEPHSFTSDLQPIWRRLTVAGQPEEHLAWALDAKTGAPIWKAVRSDELDGSFRELEGAVRSWRAPPAPLGTSPALELDRERRLREITREILEVPILAAQGFRTVTTLSDGARVFNRRPDVGHDHDREMSVRGDYLAVTRDSDTGDLLCKLLSHAEAKTLAKDAGPTFAAVRGREHPLHEFIANDSLLEPAHLERELRAWRDWSREHDLPPLRSYVGRGVGERGPEQELQATWQFGLEIAELGFKPYTSIGDAPVWRRQDEHGDKLLVWHLAPDGTLRGKIIVDPADVFTARDYNAVSGVEYRLDADALPETTSLADALRVHPPERDLTADEATFLERVADVRATLRAGPEGPADIDGSRGFPVTPFMQAQGFTVVDDMAAHTRLFVRDGGTTPGDGPAPATDPEYIAVQEMKDGRVLFKRVTTNLALIRADADVLVLSDVEGPARPLAELVLEESGHSLTAEAADREIAAWSAWERHRIDAPLRGVRLRAAQGGLSAEDELAYAAAFSSSLRASGFEPYSGTDDLLPIWRSADGQGERRLTWRIGAAGEPSWKWGDASAESVSYDQVGAGAPERSWREPPSATLEHVPGAVPAQLLDTSRAEPAPTGYELHTSFEGTTAEGLPCEYVTVHDAAAPEGSPPLRIFGSYSSRDGGGDFTVDRVGDEYVDHHGNRRPRPEDLVPWVIDQGEVRAVGQDRVPVQEVEIDLLPDRSAVPALGPDPASRTAIARIVYHPAPNRLANLVSSIERDAETGVPRVTLYGASGPADLPALLQPPPAREEYHVLLAQVAADGRSQMRTRALLAQMQMDLGRPLLWVAGDHLDDPAPHTHIVIRGVDAHGKELGLEHYLRGLNAKAQTLYHDTAELEAPSAGSLVGELVELPDGRLVPTPAHAAQAPALFDSGLADEPALAPDLALAATVTLPPHTRAEVRGPDVSPEPLSPPAPRTVSPPLPLSPATLVQPDADDEIASATELHGPGAALGALADARRAEANISRLVDATSKIALTGIITWGPESTVDHNGQPISRAVIWNLADTDNPGPKIVVFPAPFAKDVEHLRAGEFVTISGLPHEDAPRLPWHAWVTSVTLPGADEPIERLLTAPPMPDVVVRSTFGVPHMHRPEPLIPGHRRFTDAAREPAIRVSTDFDEVRLTKSVHEYSQHHNLSPHAEEAVRMAFLGSRGQLPASLAADLQAWATTRGLGQNLMFETTAQALNRQFVDLARLDPTALDRMGLSPATLEARPFRSMLRVDEHGVVGLTTNDHGAVALVRTPFHSPGHFDTISGRGPGLWLSASNRDGTCSRIILTQSPATAMAFHQQNPADDVQYIAVGGDRMTDIQKAGLQKVLDGITRANAGRKPELVVTAHHGAAGLRLYSDAERALPGWRVQGVVPKHGLGRDWIEAARNDRAPEQRLDLPAYAASRLGYQEIFRSRDNTQVVMTLPSGNVARDPATQAWLAAGPRPLADGTWVIPGKRPTDERLLFTRQPDGSWRYQADRAQPIDGGNAAQFAKAKLNLSLDEVRLDARRFALEQEVMSHGPLLANSPALAARGIHPDLAASKIFKDTLRVDPVGRLIYAHQDARGVSGIEKVPISPDAVHHGHHRSGTKGLWMSNQNPNGRVPQKLVIVQSPMVALAYHQQNPAEHVLYVATLGASLSPGQKATLRELVDRTTKANHTGKLDLVVATSRNRGGQDFASTVMRAIPEHAIHRHTPALGQTWLESVQHHQCDTGRSRPGPTRKRPSLAHGL